MHLNIDAFYNYRRLITLWTLYNFTTARNMNDECAGIFKNLACWVEFPACIDNGNQTWVIKYLIREKIQIF